MSIATLAVPSKGRLRETALERLAVIVADEIVARLATYARSRPGGTPAGQP